MSYYGGFQMFPHRDLVFLVDHFLHAATGVAIELSGTNIANGLTAAVIDRNPDGMVSSLTSVGVRAVGGIHTVLREAAVVGDHERA